MSLNFDISRCANRPPGEMTDEEMNGPIWIVSVNLMLCDMSSYVTSDDLEEFLFRIRYRERLFGNTAIVEGKSAPVPVELLRRYQGITVNVIHKTCTKWVNDQGRILAREVRGKVARELQPVI